MAKSAHTEPKTINKKSRRLAGGKRTIDQKEQDLAIVSAMLFAGKTHHEIAEHLCKLHEDTAWITRSNVSRDADLLLRRWRELSTCDMADAKGKELAKLDAIERKAWEFIDAVGGKTTTLYNVRRLKADRAKGTAAGHGGKKETMSVGHWLHMIRWAAERRAKLLGLDAPLKIDTGEGEGIIGAAGASFSMVQLNINVGSDKTLDDLRAAQVQELPIDEDDETAPDA